MMVTIVACATALVCLGIIARTASPPQVDTSDPRVGRRALSLGGFCVMGFYLIRLGRVFITDPPLVILASRVESLFIAVFLGLMCFGFHVQARAPMTRNWREWRTHTWQEPRGDLYGILAFLLAAALLLVFSPADAGEGRMPVLYAPGVQVAIGAIVLPLIGWMGLMALATGRQAKLSPRGRMQLRGVILVTVIWLTNRCIFELFLAPLWRGWMPVGLLVDMVLLMGLTVVLAARRGTLQIVDAIDKFGAAYLSHNMAEGMVAVDTEGIVRAVNLPAERSIGRPARDLVGRSAADVLDSNQWVLGNPEQWHGAPVEDEVVLQFAGPDGQPVYTASRTAILADTMGLDVGRVEIRQDITAYRQAQERLWQYSHELEERIAERSRALAESEARYRGLVDHLADSLLIVQDQTVRFANPAAEALWRGTGVPLVGMNVDALWDTGVTSSWLELRAHLAEHPQVAWRGEMEWRGGPDAARGFLVTASIARWEEEPAVLLVGTDNTERRELQASFDRVRRLQALGTLTGGIAHDFNNYLTSIMGRLAMLQELTEEAGPAHLQVTGALEAAEKGRALISRLMRFSRTNDDGRQPTDLTQLLRETEPLLVSLLREDIRLEWQLPTAPLWAEVDPAAIQEILLNLAKNAEDAMEDASGVLVIRARAPEGLNPPMAQILVTDTGSGITQEVCERLFEPFFTTKPEGQGHGLGLALAHQIMQEHEGVIDVQSMPDRGATFTLTLPQCAPPESPPAPRAGTAMIEGAGELVLVVDDDAGVRQTACDMLGRLGYEITTAEHGRAALDVVAQEDGIAAVLMDLVMPEMNGVDCALELKERGFRAPIIFMTGYDPDPQRLRQLGPNVVAIRKPFRLKELSAILRDEIAGAQAHA